MGQFGSKGGLRRVVPIKEPQGVAVEVGSVLECIALAIETGNADAQFGRSAYASSVGETTQDSMTRLR